MVLFCFHVFWKRFVSAVPVAAIQVVQVVRCTTVAAIQVVQVVRCTRAHDPTSEDQIAFFEKLISSVSHVASHSGYCREIVF